MTEDAFEHYPDKAFLYGQLSSLNVPPGDTGTAEISIEPEQLKGYSTPTLMVGGEKDRIFAPGLLREVAEIIPGAALHVIPVTGHSPYFEKPDEFNRVVLDFLQTVVVSDAQ